VGLRRSNHLLMWFCNSMGGRGVVGSTSGKGKGTILPMVCQR
jgi:hypothetical protein